MTLNEKIEDLNNQLTKYPYKLNENENLISVIFASVDQLVHYSIICKNTSKSCNLEDELYTVFPIILKVRIISFAKEKLLINLKHWTHIILKMAILLS